MSLLNKPGLMAKLVFYLTFVFLTFLPINIIAQNGKEFKRSKNYVQGELILKFKKSICNTRVLNIIQSAGSEKIGKIKEDNLVCIKLEKGKSVEEAISEFKNDPSIEYVQPNYIYKIISTNPDPYYRYQ